MKQQEHLFPYKWKLSDINFVKDKGKVFSCFSCGGGSTMGYKLAGFDVIGCNEIDPKLMNIYKTNHKPKYNYLESIRTLKNRDDLPKELYNLDILDGSPPCSSFSISGNRGKDWGKEKKFKEGQTKQILDTLFFDFIEFGEKLQPKIIIVENVPGLTIGNAKKYVREILIKFKKSGYKVDFKQLDASIMGVPQKRQRIFFYAIRNDLKCSTIDLFFEKPKLNLIFNESFIPFKEIEDSNAKATHLSPIILKYWRLTQEGNRFSKIHPKGFLFNHEKAHRNKPLTTITAHPNGQLHPVIPRKLTKTELLLGSTFPLDFNFLNQKVKYICGMSVPPIMMAQIATRIYDQWLINN